MVFTSGANAPNLGMMLSDYAEGDIVLLNESGSPVEFYVAKHDYESGLNGAGRTLLVRKDCYDSRAWHSSEVNAYATSDIDAWLNGDYKALFDAAVQMAMGTTTFYYTPGNGDTTVTTLSRSAFMLSVTELGTTFGNANTEGVALPIASTLQIAYRDGSAHSQMTRSPHTGTTRYANYLRDNGLVNTNVCTTARGSRPVFTLPATAKFDPNTNQFIGGAA